MIDFFVQIIFDISLSVLQIVSQIKPAEYAE